MFTRPYMITCFKFVLVKLHLGVRPRPHGSWSLYVMYHIIHKTINKLKFAFYYCFSSLLLYLFTILNLVAGEVAKNESPTYRRTLREELRESASFQRSDGGLYHVGVHVHDVRPIQEARSAQRWS